MPSDYEPDELPDFSTPRRCGEARQGRALCIMALDPGLVVLSSVTEMLFADSMLRIDFEAALLSHQRQVFLDPHAAVVKEYVMVRTQAQDVVWRVRPVVRGPEWPDVSSLRVGSSEAL